MKLGSFCTLPGLAEGVTSCGSLMAPKQVAQSQSQAASDIGLTTPEYLQTYLIHSYKHKEAVKMGRQRNRPQIKEQENFPEEELNEMEARNFSDIEFREMIMKVFNSMKKDLETIKKDQSEIKNTIFEINNTLEGINSRLDETEDQISDLENKVEKITQAEQKKEKNNFKK